MSEKMREEFEAWGRLNGYEVGHKSEDGVYIGGATAIAWESWQASRASLVVEMPEWGSAAEFHNSTPVMSRDAVLSAHEAAGLKVKRTA